MLVLVALLACSDDPSPAVAPSPAPVVTVAPQIGDPPPPLGAAGRALEVIAVHYGVGLARCPIEAIGAVPRVWGTGRDVLRELGPTWLLDLDARGDAPWDPAYDVGFVEEGWVTLLAAPGSTGGLLRPDTRTLALTWPAAEAGGAVACTEVQTYAPRVVEGSVQGRPVLVGCSAPTRVAEDGSFRLEVPVPCTLWAESRGRRSDTVAVAPGEPLRLELVLRDDPSWADADLSEQGRLRLAALIEAERKAVRDHLTALDLLVDGAEPDLAPQLGRWRMAQHIWLGDLEGIAGLLAEPR